MTEKEFLKIAPTQCIKVYYYLKLNKGYTGILLYFSQCIYISVPTLINAIKWLKEHNMIDYKSTGGKHKIRTYWVTDERFWK